MTSGLDTPIEWLRQWEAAINRQDYPAARRLFADDVLAFGTFASAMTGLSALEERQWRQIWPTIRSFSFEDSHVLGATDQGLVAIITRWRSQGRRTGVDWYERAGRATLLLRREGAGLQCCHTHFSMDPGIPARLIDLAAP